MKCTGIIMTFNEEMHIERCIRSLQSIASEIYVIDCFSTDRTCDIAKKLNCKVLTRAWKCYSDQFNWSLGNLSDEVDWVFRLDADEYLSDELINFVNRRVLSGDITADGIHFKRYMQFCGDFIKYGGIGGVSTLRMFKRNKGKCENRLMDEHIVVEGRQYFSSTKLYDSNLNNLTWWIQKHNLYSNREAVEVLNNEYNFINRDRDDAKLGFSNAGIKRFVKNRIYNNLPPGSRALLYFLYRYIVLFGFLDGYQGLKFHVLQGFWYRYLVDCKVSEVKQHINLTRSTVQDAIYSKLGINVNDIV